MKTIWLNLPVKDLQKSKQFFREIGFRENDRHKEASHLGSFYIGDNDFVLMLFPEGDIKKYTQNEITDTSQSNEMLIKCQDNKTIKMKRKEFKTTINASKEKVWKGAFEKKINNL